ncbi:MAG: hypothetical protein MUC56_08870 [Thermoanaerobaculales bacterium]|jgi:hypothetical protein|nr:hypothetical protein [Thermoanaerobaculales bacterium]
MTEEKTSLRQAVSSRGPLAVWDLMTDDEKRAAAVALWKHADLESRMAVEMVLAKEMKFRPQSVRKLSADRVAPRLARLAAELPESALFQFLFHLHMAERRGLMIGYLDAVGLPHREGVLELPDDAEPPTPEAAAGPARALVAEHGRDALVYLATLAVADADFWAGILPVLEGWDETGEALPA